MWVDLDVPAYGRTGDKEVVRVFGIRVHTMHNSNNKNGDKEIPQKADPPGLATNEIVGPCETLK